MDFVYMGESDTKNLMYLLLIKDDLTGYTWFYASETADSEAATCALSKWIASFGCMMWIVSDRGAHFTAEVMKKLIGEAHIRHHLTTAYCTWANRTIEHACKEVLRA